MSLLYSYELNFMLSGLVKIISFFLSLLLYFLNVFLHQITKWRHFYESLLRQNQLQEMTSA